MKGCVLVAILIGAVFVLTLQSCSIYDHYTQNRINGTSITASMSDQEIVKAFGIDTATATTKKVNGKDGTMSTYSSGEQEVSIARSTVTGVSVVATGSIKGTWELGIP